MLTTHHEAAHAPARQPVTRRPTALLIPCPADEASATWYRAWVWFYHRTRQLRHRLGLHDWVDSYPSDGHRVYHHRRCTWCGKPAHVE